MLIASPVKGALSVLGSGGWGKSSGCLNEKSFVNSITCLPSFKGTSAHQGRGGIMHSSTFQYILGHSSAFQYVPVHSSVLQYISSDPFVNTIV